MRILGKSTATLPCWMYGRSHSIAFRWYRNMSGYAPVETRMWREDLFHWVGAGLEGEVGAVRGSGAELQIPGAGLKGEGAHENPDVSRGHARANPCVCVAGLQGIQEAGEAMQGQFHLSSLAL